MTEQFSSWQEEIAALRGDTIAWEPIRPAQQDQEAPIKPISILDFVLPKDPKTKKRNYLRFAVLTIVVIAALAAFIAVWAYSPDAMFGYDAPK